MHVDECIIVNNNNDYNTNGGTRCVQAKRTSTYSIASLFVCTHVNPHFAMFVLHGEWFNGALFRSQNILHKKYYCLVQRQDLSVRWLCSV